MGRNYSKEQMCRGDDGKIRFHKEKPSRHVGKTILRQGLTFVKDMDPWQEWENDLYSGTLRRYTRGSPFGGGAYAVIGINTLAGDARHDFREYQEIKNALVGEEWEAVELYPAESRLIDPSNHFYLWCFPPGVLAALGLPLHERKVQGPEDGGPPQRPFPEDE